ncbi:hypothetical protein [Natronosalvus rutilus]|uniref:Uncharacterized protein n=1 Tax=Natronosalvus rutilus TaxID=2953753 RepID=A0A9E7NBF8_9EURY|nr:hypothetical protein [Natronosalvus rutilus]UTF53888.1 hypothetical protein NGM29_00980 [Natronosalvus rutilus]
MLEADRSDESERDESLQSILNWVPNAVASDDYELVVTADAPAALVDDEGYSLQDAVGETISVLEASQVDARVLIDPYRILVGSFDAATVTDGLNATTEGSVGAFDRIVDDHGTEHAVRDGEAIVRTIGSSVDGLTLESIVDAREGSDSLVEKNSVFKRLSNKVSTDTYVEISLTPSNDEWRGFGIGYEIAPEQSTATVAIVLTTEGRGLDDERIRGFLEFLFGPTDVTLDDLERNADLVTARAPIPTDEI